MTIPENSFTAFQSSSPPASANPPNYAFTPRFLPVIAAGDGDYFYLGGGLLVVGVIALISLLTGGGRRRRYKYEFQEHPFDLPWPRPLDRHPLPSRFYSSQNMPSPQASKEAARVPPTTETEPSRTDFRGISPRVVKSYTNTKSEAVSSNASSSPSSSSTPPSSSDTHRKLVDRIVSQARSGLADSEIARQMGISRDEVRMILNLAHLAEREQS